MDMWHFGAKSYQTNPFAISWELLRYILVIKFGFLKLLHHPRLLHHTSGFLPATFVI